MVGKGLVPTFDVVSYGAGVIGYGEIDPMDCALQAGWRVSEVKDRSRVLWAGGRKY